jgi:ankyrin
VTIRNNAVQTGHSGVALLNEAFRRLIHPEDTHTRRASIVSSYAIPTHDRNRQFFKAIKVGDLDAVEDFIVKKRVNPNVRSIDESRTCPLIEAARNGDLPMIDLLLYHGAELDCKAGNGKTPLICALEAQKIDAALALIQRGADARREDARSKGADINHGDENGIAALHVAAKKNMYPVVQVLLDNGANPNCRSKQGYTPLMLSVLRDDRHLRPFSLNVLRVLLEPVGDRPAANPAHPTSEETGEVTALHIASSRGFNEDLRVIAESTQARSHRACARLDAQNRSALWLAAEKGNIVAVRILVNQSLSVLNETSEDGNHYTPLWAAASYGHGAAVEIMDLLLKAKADGRTLNNKGQTVMHRACELGDVRMVNLLLRWGISTVGDEKGRQPLVCLPANSHPYRPTRSVG